MSAPLEPQLGEAVTRDTIDTHTLPLDREVLEARALLRIADELSLIRAAMEKLVKGVSR